MQIFSLTFGKHAEFNRLKSEYEKTSAQIVATGSIIQKIENKEWAIATEKIKSLPESTLTQRLSKLNENLRTLWVQEENRDWINKGLIKIGQVISQNQGSMTELGTGVIQTLANYSKACQGGLFVAHNSDPKNPFFEMLAGYACEWKNNLKKINIDEGMIGRCYKEGEPIYVTNIPAGYIKITSGLGEASPRCIMIIPLILGKQKMGVIELAYFRQLQSHERDFLTGTSEMIANAIFNIQNNAKTLELLTRAEAMSSELKSNEEELRQNLEEMQSIQDALSRKNEALEKTRLELEIVTQREKELIESKLSTQQVINDKIVSTLRRKIEQLQTELSMAKEYKASRNMIIELKSN